MFSGGIEKQHRAVIELIPRDVLFVICRKFRKYVFASWLIACFLLLSFWKTFCHFREPPETSDEVSPWTEAVVTSCQLKNISEEQRTFVRNGLTHIMPLVSFYILLKTSENQSFSVVFRSYRNRPVAWNWLKRYTNANLKIYQYLRLHMKIMSKISH